MEYGVIPGTDTPGRNPFRRGKFSVNSPNQAVGLSSHLFETLMDQLQEGVYFVDRARSIQFWNRGAEVLTGYPRDEVVGRCCAANILAHINDAGESMCTGLCPLAGSMSDGQPCRTEAYLRHKEGHRLPVLIRTSPIRDDSGAIIGALETFTDNTTQVAALERIANLEQQALMCPLTLVGNRRYAETILAEKMSEWDRYERSFGVVFIDVDHFKSINDQYGHAVGDVTLKMVAATIRNDLRTFDFVGRWGGEEFLVLLQTDDAEELEKAANRLRVLVFNTSKQVSKGRIQLTVSAGTTMVKKGDAIPSLIKRADDAMYDSKRQGRNLVTFG
jgi:diguanylate cyclase (GGDEF)-like protein/PAS domain S-box-containing protein